MVYLLNSFDFELFSIDEEMMRVDMWKTTEDRVRRWIKNERTRSIFTRQEIINLFDAGKIQMVQINKVKLKPFDKVIIWTKEKNFFVIEVVSLTK